MILKRPFRSTLSLAVVAILLSLPATNAAEPLQQSSDPVGTKEFFDPVVSVDAGTFDSQADYDAMKPIETLKLEKFGRVKPTPYPGGGTQVVRGVIQIINFGCRNSHGLAPMASDRYASLLRS